MLHRDGTVKGTVRGDEGMAVELIDLHFGGVPRAVGAWLVDEEIIVDPGPESTIGRLLEALGERRPRAIALTHIHLDHAGATGALLDRWPDCEVWVHRLGAPHLVSPERLLASAARVYGELMGPLYGGLRPVPAQAIRLVGEGLRIGPFDVLETPGHAVHHVTYLHEPSGTAFTGDVAGVRVAPSPLVLAPTVAPEFDPDLWRDSIARLAERAPSRVALTHCGAFDDVQEHLASAAESVTRWSRAGRDLDHAAFTAAVMQAISTSGDRVTAASMTAASQPPFLWPGARRYWERRGP
jgi:glyoxylase-like metal-dependent hydrolase (beta-lactamase superfamily II)